ncbi:MAG TPA: metal-dependent hydrolase [Pirellulaceae bacterium]|nr:metal-dependent hydrolase [Pirellulaceae bacterium]
MADFKTHITTSTVLGIGYGAVGHLYFGVPLPHCVVAGTLCSVAGMLPDLDSDSGIPIRETLCFVSVLIPTLLWERFVQLGWHPEFIVFAAVLIYLFIRFALGPLFRKYTVHRGMWHSIPAALIAGLITFLFGMSTDLGIRIFKSWSVVLGFMSHLMLDEVYSVDWRGQRIKKSLGTAMKWFGPKWWGNVSTYGKLVLLVILAMGDTALMNHLGRDPIKVEFADWSWLTNLTQVWR